MGSSLAFEADWGQVLPFASISSSPTLLSAQTSQPHAFLSFRVTAFKHSSCRIPHQFNANIIYGGNKLAAHPSQPWVYAADRGSSPDEIHKFDVSSTPATQLYDSPYHGDYAFCSDLWIAEDGLRLYTACGNTFRLSANKDIDLTYAGKFTLSENFLVKSLAENVACNEFTVVERGPYTCEWSWSYEPCLTRISSYNRDFLSNRKLRTVPLLFVNDDHYFQEALAVFYNQDNSKRFILSKLPDMPSMAEMYYIAEIAF